jgi:hypothetical protein
LGPVVLDGWLRFISVSQIEKHDPACDGGCPRKWWFRYVGKIKEKARRAQKLGDQIHAQTEHYLKTGEDVLGPMAGAMRRFLPKPKTSLLVETSIGKMREHEPGGIHGAVDSPLTCADVPVIGRVDLIDMNPDHVIDVPGDDGPVAKTVHEPGIVEIADWKSTKQIDDEVNPETGLVRKRGYAKTAEQLANSHQMAGYAELIRRDTGKAVRVSHGYTQTEGPLRAEKRSVVISPSQIVGAFLRSVAVVEQMKSTARATRAADVAPNYDACHAYGGCPYLGNVCERDPVVSLQDFIGRSAAAKLKGEPMGFLTDKLNQKAAAPPPPLDPAVAAEKQRLLDEEAAAARGTAVAAPDAPASSAPAEIPSTPAPMGCASGQQVKLDMDAIATKKFTCSCGLIVKVKPAKLGDGAYYAFVPEHGAKPAEAPAPEKAPEPAKSEPPTAQQVVEEPAAALDETFRQLAPAKPVESKAVQALYLDCVPDAIPTKRLETYAAEKAQKLADVFNEGRDIRTATGEKNILAFGKYKGVLAALVKAEPPPLGYYVVSSSSEFGMIAFEVLATDALVVRGVR